ncbi:MAG: putative ABC transporter permease [Bacilli bacterium]
METIAKYFLYFIIYAFLGWLMEVICKLIEDKRFINRGFLIGPICPIYGYGVLSIVLLIGSYKGDILSVFLKSIFVCSILEYITSYLMEKIFKARWWDYSTSRFNLNGRICLDTMIPFGILSVFVIYVLHPFIISLVEKISLKMQVVLAIILFIIYLADNIFSYTIMNKIKNEIKDTNKDNTEAIKQYMVKWLDENSIFYRRIKDAYPNFIIKIKKINNNIKEISDQAKEKYEKKKRK